MIFMLIQKDLIGNRKKEQLKIFLINIKLKEPVVVLLRSHGNIILF